MGEEIEALERRLEGDPASEGHAAERGPTDAEVVEQRNEVGARREGSLAGPDSPKPRAS
ncbi:MAG TPA: hypothetical protein VFU34_04025 [Gaiellaceae bacterium]|nr:hypothetical protein [Gaiellaceae bacterium]